MGKLDLTGLDDTDFEEFCFELLTEVGFVNVDWRKGTPLASSPADRGRDIVAEWERVDPDGSKHREVWFVECKHHKKAVPPAALQSLLAWSHADRPHTALVIASGFLSNPAKDFLRNYEQNNRPPFGIKYWERPIIERLTRDKREFLDRFLVGGMRSQSEIVAAEDEYFNRVWHERKLVMFMNIEEGRDTIAPELMAHIEQAIKDIKVEYGEDSIRPVNDDFEWGLWNGKLSALRWVLGDDWDNLDT